MRQPRSSRDTSSPRPPPPVGVCWLAAESRRATSPVPPALSLGRHAREGHSHDAHTRARPGLPGPRPTTSCVCVCVCVCVCGEVCLTLPHPTCPAGPRRRPHLLGRRDAAASRAQDESRRGQVQPGPAASRSGHTPSRLHASARGDTESAAVGRLPLPSTSSHPPRTHALPPSTLHETASPPPRVAYSARRPVPRPPGAGCDI